MNSRQMTIDDITQVQNIEQTAWGRSAATHEQIKERYNTFPEGSIVVENEKGQLFGYATAQLVNEISTKSWAEQTDNGFITHTHIPDGQIAYGVSMSALPEAANYGVGSIVIKHYHEIFISSGLCSVLCLGSRLPGYSKWYEKNQGDIKRYLNQTSSGFSRDPELRLYQKNGFQLLWEIEGYYPDKPSLDYGAMIVQR